MSALTFTTTADAVAEASRALYARVGVSIGGFADDPVLEDAAAGAAYVLRNTAKTALYAGLLDTQVTVAAAHFEEILAVLEADVSATTGLLARFIRDARAALAV